MEGWYGELGREDTGLGSGQAEGNLGQRGPLIEQVSTYTIMRKLSSSSFE